MGKASVKIQTFTHTKELTQEKSPLHVTNVGKNSVRTPTLLNIGEPTQVNSHIPVGYARETSAGGQAFLDTRNSTNEGKLVQWYPYNEEIHQMELDTEVGEKCKIMKHEEFFIIRKLGIYVMIHRTIDPAVGTLVVLLTVFTFNCQGIPSHERCSKSI